MIDVAAGLSLAGNKVYVYAMAPFITLRCYEQLKCSLAMMDLPITVIAVGPGLGYADAGPTHYLTEDFACLRALVNCEVYSASDSIMSKELAELTYQAPALRIIRLDRNSSPDIYSKYKLDLKRGFSELYSGDETCIVSYGYTLQKILKDEKNPAQRKHLLVGKIEDVINTVVRQISFYEFECRIHDQRKKGELTTDSISKIWMDISRESLGDSFEYNESYKYFWSYVPHFVHSPFYVYAYAFGDGLVNSLYSAYKSGMTGFENKYLEMLSSGGSKSHNCLLRPFNLNISNLNFWERGICVLKGLIDELESLS